MPVKVLIHVERPDISAIYALPVDYLGKGGILLCGPYRQDKDRSFAFSVVGLHFVNHVFGYSVIKIV